MLLHPGDTRVDVTFVLENKFIKCNRKCIEKIRHWIFCNLIAQLPQLQGHITSPHQSEREKELGLRSLFFYVTCGTYSPNEQLQSKAQIFPLYSL